MIDSKLSKRRKEQAAFEKMVDSTMALRDNDISIETLQRKVEFLQNAVADARGVLELRHKMQLAERRRNAKQKTNTLA
jgi:hypothetical protein